MDLSRGRELWSMQSLFPPLTVIVLSIYAQIRNYIYHPYFGPSPTVSLNRSASQLNASQLEPFASNISPSLILVSRPLFLPKHSTNAAEYVESENEHAILDIISKLIEIEENLNLSEVAVDSSNQNGEQAGHRAICDYFRSSVELKKSNYIIRLFSG